MKLARRRLLCLAGATVAAPPVSRIAWSQANPTAPSAPPTDAVFPGTTWEKATPEELGWSTQRLGEARQFFQTLPAASIVVVDRVRMIVEWGDPAERIKLSSVRKSLLSALYGTPVRDGRLGLDKTLEQLGIDDDPPLTRNEKQATLRMVLQSRSGVCHSFVGGTPEMRATMPARESHPPGTFWYYNNRDFNVLGTVYERQLQKKIGEAFGSEIATPIQMQDFRPDDMYYERATEKSETFAKSVHPTYQFRLTARDMARVGYLFLRNGKWNGTQVIPADWVAESTTSYSDAGDGFGYGYLWWVHGYGLEARSFSARGALGKYIVVIPERDAVIAFVNHTEFPDVQQAMPDAEVRKLPNVSVSQMGKLLTLLINAQRQ